MRKSVGCAGLLVIVIAVAALGMYSAGRHWPLSPWYQAKWQTVSPTFARLEFVTQDKTRILLYRFNPNQVSFAIDEANPAVRVKDWQLDATTESLIVNGFYFLEDNTPAGLVVIDGQVQGGAAFDWDKSGVITLEPEFAIIDTTTQPFDPESNSTAGQAYPFLLKNGQPAILESSGLVARRSFLGTDQDGQAYIGVVWHSSISLFDLGRKLTEVPVVWDEVINLDGGPSTGISIRTDDFTEDLNSASGVPSAIVVTPQQ